MEKPGMALHDFHWIFLLHDLSKPLYAITGLVDRMDPAFLSSTSMFFAVGPDHHTDK